MTESTAQKAHGVLDVFLKLPTAVQIVLILMGAGGALGVPTTISNIWAIGPKLETMVRRDSLRAMEIDGLRADIADQAEELRETRTAMEDLNLQISNIACRTERLLEPQACDAIRDQARAALRRIVGEGR